MLPWSSHSGYLNLHLKSPATLYVPGRLVLVLFSLPWLLGTWHACQDCYPCCPHRKKKRPVFLNPPLLELHQLVKDQQCFLNQLHLGGHFSPSTLLSWHSNPRLSRYHGNKCCDIRNWLIIDCLLACLCQVPIQSESI